MARKSEPGGSGMDINPDARLDPSQVVDNRAGAPVDPLTAPLQPARLGEHKTPMGMGAFLVDNNPRTRNIPRDVAPSARGQRLVAAPTATGPAKTAKAPTSADWGNPDNADYAQQHIVTIHTDGLTFAVNENVATQFAGFIHALVLAGYHPRVVQGYDNRPVTGGTAKSNHAYGAAIDIDPGINPRYTSSKGGQYALPPNVGQIAAQYGIVWGGDYKNTKDYMHFEAADAPRTPKPLAQKVTAMASTKPTPTAAPATAPMTDQQIRDYVISHYGYAASYLHDPEIGPILLDAAKRGLGDDELRGKLSATKWWKTHTDSQVAWDNLNEQNPATAQAKVQATMATIGAVAQQRGIALSGLQIHDLAVLDLRNGWNDDQLTNAMAYHAKLDPTVGGKGATTKDALRQQASQYLVPVADSTLDKWALDIGSGKVSQENFNSYLRGMAKSLHPDAATAIDSGVTTAQYYDPYKQIAADTLDVPVESVNFSDPKWNRALFQIDPKTGARTTMSLADWGQTLRTDPTYGYSKTPKATSTAADFAQMLTQKWGAVAV